MAFFSAPRGRLAERSWLVVGLGNPGSRYAATWHNCGWLALDLIAARHGIRVGKARFHGAWGQGDTAAGRLILLKPETYMNESGRSVAAALHWFKLPPERLVVLYDDVDIARGQVRIRQQGGPGSHRGMQSVIGELGTGAFPRIRIGIGPQPGDRDIVAFVLEAIPAEQRPLMREAFEMAADAVDLILKHNVDLAMNRINARRPAAEAAEKTEPAETTDAG